jgi:hypothetical protein
MNKSIVAFILANLTVSCLFYLFTLFPYVAYFGTMMAYFRQEDINPHTNTFSTGPFNPMLAIAFLALFTVVSSRVLSLQKVYFYWFGQKTKYERI